MAQIFPKWTLDLPLAVGLSVPVLVVLLVGGVWYYGSPRFTDVGYAPEQPVPYSHKLHAGQLGLDCRYCHASVETSAVSSVPPTKVCMNCHHVVKRESPLLEPIRASEETKTSMRWIRVHNLPDYAYFNHAAHIHAGVGCASCHGQIQTMEVVRQAQPLSMGWCLDCHRNPGPALRPPEAITDMEWVPPSDHAEFVARVMEEKHIAPPVDCSGCHR